MYKDKNKQREANAERQRRYKAKQKALLNEGVTDESITFVTPEGKSVTFTEGEDDPNTPKRGKDIKYENGGITVPDKLGPLKPKCGKGINMKPFEKIWARNLKSIEALNDKPKPQSHNSMMVGYVPPKE